MALKLITPPVAYPVTLAEAKAHLRVDHNDEDALITTFLAASTDFCEAFLGRALMPQTWELVLDQFPTNEIKLPKPPLIEVLSVQYDDGAGDLQSYTSYSMDNVSEPGWIVPDGSWPGTFDGINAVRIRYRAGYFVSDSPTDTKVPDDLKAAVLLYMGSLYANRETIITGTIAAQVPWSAEQLLRRKRIDLSMA